MNCIEIDRADYLRQKLKRIDEQIRESKAFRDNYATDIKCIRQRLNEVADGREYLEQGLIRSYLGKEHHRYMLQAARVYKKQVHRQLEKLKNASN